MRQIPSNQPVVGNVPATGFYICMKFKGIPKNSQEFPKVNCLRSLLAVSIPKIPTMKSLRQVCSEGLEMGISRLIVKIDDSHHEHVDD